MTSKNLVIRENGTQLIPWDHICCGLSVQTIGSRFAPKNYLKLCESIGFPKLGNQLSRDKNISNDIVIEDIKYQFSDQQIQLNQYSLEKRDESLKLIDSIDDKQLPKYTTQLTEEDFVTRFVDQKLLEYDRAGTIIEQMLEQMKTEYFLSLKISIIDYVLKQGNLFIKTNFIQNCLNFGFNDVKQMNVTFNFTSDPTLLQIVSNWETKYRNLNIFDFDLSKILDFNEFKSRIAQNCHKINFRLKYEWISDCNQILLNNCAKFIKYDCIQNKKFFDAIASLMSRLFRDLILKNLENWINILSDTFEKTIALFRIDIKCKPRGNPYLIPSVNKLVEILLFPSTYLLECNKNIDRVENNLILLKHKRLPRKFLFKIQVADSDIQNHHCQILSIADKINFDQIIEIYKTEFSEQISEIIIKFESNNQNPEYISTLFESCNNIIVDLIVSSNELNIGFLKINFCDFKGHVKNLIEDQINKIIASQVIELLSYAKHICIRFSMIEQDLKELSKSCYELMNNLKQMKIMKSTINLMMFDIQYIENNWNTIVENGTKLSIITESDFEVLHRIYYWPQRIQLLFSDREKGLQIEKIEIQSKLQSKITAFQSNIKNLTNILNNFEKKKISSPFECISDNCGELNDISNSLKQYFEECQDINSQQEILGLMITDFEILTELNVRTNHLVGIWGTASLFKETENNCLSKSFRSLDLKDIKQTIDKLLASCDQMMTTYKSHYLIQNVNYLQTNIECFKTNYIPLIEVFSSHVLRQRHWHKINEIIGQKISLAGSCTFSDVISVSNPVKYIDQIKSLGKIARKEYELELLLEKMKDEWVNEWPEEALEVVANKLLEEESLEFGIRQKCAKAFKFIHLDSIDSVKVINEKMREDIPINYCVTASMFIHLIQTFKDLLKEKFKEINSKRNKYFEGIENSNSVVKSLKEMKNQMINDFQPILLTSFAETESLMIKIEKESHKIEVQKEIIGSDEAVANRSAASAQKIKDECYKELTQAVPAIRSAISALNTLKSEDITFLRSMKCPPPAVRTVLEAVCILNDFKPERKLDLKTNHMFDDYWNSSLRMMSDIRFLDKLRNYDRNAIQRNTIDLIRQKYLHSVHFEPTTLKRVSKACEGLANWVRAIDIYDRLINVVKPKREKLKLAEIELKDILEALNYKKIQLTNTTDFLQQLNDEFSVMSKKKKELEDKRGKCRSKLVRVQQLIDCLKARISEWTHICGQLKERKHQIVAELILSAALIIYTCALEQEQRSYLINKWQNYLENECNFSLSEQFHFIKTLANNNQILKWVGKGMSTHSFDIENAIICDRSRRLSIIINNNNIVSKWLSRLYPDLTRIDLQVENENNLPSLLIDAFKRGGLLLIENVGQIHSNSVIKQLIESNVINEKQTEFIQFGDQIIELEPTFKVYICCSQYICDLSPKMLSKITLINWITSEQRWTDSSHQTLNEVQLNYISELEVKIEKEKQLIEEEKGFIELVFNEKSNLLNEKNFIESLAKSEGQLKK